MCGFFKRKCLGFQEFIQPTQPPLIFSVKSCRDLSPGTGTLGWRAWCGAGTPCSKFLSTHGWGVSPFRICASPTSLNECSSLNSTVVRLPFNYIFDSSEWFFIITLNCHSLNKRKILTDYFIFQSQDIRLMILIVVTADTDNASRKLFWEKQFYRLFYYLVPKVS